MPRPTLLELELDDWLDPSLPRAYTLESSDDDDALSSCSTDFTDDNPAFRDTPAAPPYLPVRLSPRGRHVRLEPAPGVPAGILSQHSLTCPTPQRGYMEALTR